MIMNIGLYLIISALFICVIWLSRKIGMLEVETKNHLKQIDILKDRLEKNSFIIGDLELKYRGLRFDFDMKFPKPTDKQIKDYADALKYHNELHGKEKDE